MKYNQDISLEVDTYYIIPGFMANIFVCKMCFKGTYIEDGLNFTYMNLCQGLPYHIWHDTYAGCGLLTRVPFLNMDYNPAWINKVKLNKIIFPNIKNTVVEAK